MRGETRQVTIRASAWQVTCWESTARWTVKGGDVQRFIVCAADLLARRLREVNYQRGIPDLVAQRLHEKTLLGQLLKAARNAVQHLPKEAHCHTYGRLTPKQDLQRAIENVRDFLKRTGEEYPCED